MDQKRCSFPDKIPVNRYPTHFPISGNRGFGAGLGLKAGWGVPVDSSVGGWVTGCSYMFVKKQGVPRIAFRFRHGFRLRLYNEEVSTGKHNDRRYPLMHKDILLCMV